LLAGDNDLDLQHLGARQFFRLPDDFRVVMRYQPPGQPVLDRLPGFDAERWLTLLPPGLEAAETNQIARIKQRFAVRGEKVPATATARLQTQLPQASLQKVEFLRESCDALLQVILIGRHPRLSILQASVRETAARARAVTDLLAASKGAPISAKAVP